MILELKVNKSLRGVTAFKVLARISNEVLSTYKDRPWGMPPLEVNLFVVKERVEQICEEERQKATKGMMHGSFISVRLDLEHNQVKVYKLNQTKEDDLFFTLTKMPNNE